MESIVSSFLDACLLLVCITLIMSRCCGTTIFLGPDLPCPAEVSLGIGSRVLGRASRHGCWCLHGERWRMLCTKSVKAKQIPRWGELECQIKQILKRDGGDLQRERERERFWFRLFLSFYLPVGLPHQYLCCHHNHCIS